MIIGCTGHQNLGERTRRLVAHQIIRIIGSEADDQSPLIGVSNLAEGADQLFAFLVLAAGGQLQPIIPSAHYETSFANADARNNFESLLHLSVNEVVLPFDRPSEDAYLAGGLEVARRSDLLLAVWDGKEAAGRGGTADVVRFATDHGVDVRIVWPAGARRG